VRGVDDLRTRVAAAIERSLVEQFPSDLPDRYGEWIDNTALADAVIRELGLREQTGNNAAYPQVIPCSDYLRTHHRYVTEWKADDE